MKENNIIDIVLSGMNDSDDGFIPIISEIDNIQNTPVPDTLPLLPLKNTVLFPGIVIPISISRKKSIKLVKDVYKKNKYVGIVTQKSVNTEDPKADDLYQVGTVAQIIKILEMPDDSTSIIIQGIKRFKIAEITAKDPYFQAKIDVIIENTLPTNDKEFDALVGSLKDLSIKIIKLSSNIPHETSFAVKNIENASFLINYICSNSDIKIEEKQKLLETDDIKQRATFLLEYLVKEVQMLELKNDIQSKVKTDMDKQQKEFLLHQQMKTIQEELGGSNPVDKEIEEIEKKAKKKKWGKEVATVFKKELEKLRRMHPSSAEYSIQLNYVMVLQELPWNEYTKDNFDIAHAERILDEDHFGLEKVKDRILEHLAVLKLKGDLKAPILCLYGPPGVGKTSLGKSIARALERTYVRISLGGLHDEAEIRGHRKTYIGALPGRIVQNIKKAKSSNPVFVLDEIDKIGNDFRGDPSSALLEVLDPEQNNSFYDNFLEMGYDLSKVMFIATANTTNNINLALLDRMELIEVNGYIIEEKLEIAKRHLIPKQLEAHGITGEQIMFSQEVMEVMIRDYTHESGVRALDKKLAKVLRAIAKKIASDKKYNVNITVDELREILGPPEIFNDKYQGNELAGVVTGLAWTAQGGQILFVETSLSKGKGTLTLTGKLGDVMKESAVIALEYLKAHADFLNIPVEAFENWNIHIHVPEGAIPKDGPSAGITMAVCLASAFTQRKVKPQIALTGEITLRGVILPVGGIKEKILAAKHADITEIILPADNRKDVEQINEIYLRGLSFTYVKNIKEALNIALLNEKVDKAININIEKKPEVSAVK